MTRAAHVALLAIAACGGAAPRPAQPAAKAVLIIESSVADATVWLDDQPVGEVARLASGIRLPAGDHRVELRHDTHHARFAEVTLAPGEHRVLALPLTPMEP